MTSLFLSAKLESVTLHALKKAVASGYSTSIRIARMQNVIYKNPSLLLGFSSNVANDISNIKIPVYARCDTMLSPASLVKIRFMTVSFPNKRCSIHIDAFC